MRKINVYQPDEECLMNNLYFYITDEDKHITVVYFCLNKILSEVF